MNKTNLLNIFHLVLVTILIFLSCEQNTTRDFQHQKHDKIISTNISQVPYKDIKVADKSGQNILELRLTCDDSILLNNMISYHWHLITMTNKDTGLEADLENDYSMESPSHPAAVKMQIEVIKKTIQTDVAGYYIEMMNTMNKHNNRNNEILIESEFISEFESFGGYVQIKLPELSESKYTWMKAETLDDPLVNIKSGNIIQSKLNPYLSIGFSDPNGLTHAWRVLVTHDISTFPIVYWLESGNSKLP